MYEKTTWVKGDIITAEKLNNIENGIEMTNNDYAVPLLVIPGDYTIGDTISGWDTISDYLYNTPAAVALCVSDNAVSYLYVAWGFLDLFCVGGGNSAPRIYVDENGEIKSY